MQQYADELCAGLFLVFYGASIFAVRQCCRGYALMGNRCDVGALFPWKQHSAYFARWAWFYWVALILTILDGLMLFSIST